ncbi:type IA DNA topoisomerase [Streptococcus iniae]|uniref:DNA topoisomerase III n=1 Tax=Streptococcus iniae TaxID=1346 RepID=UPI0002DADC78|nr:DNA topoisomerase III [Streptococcus iniae]ESR10518.1 DNA topoisomerase [Streptococcus iniae IUSA1]KYJ81244.1 DNA topoisomerase III [Streptococcus iniae]RMI73082.1 type IA DNA topoisomerase [Streptococcus iniae]HEK4517271.1 DNA topoisomerase III [Streptococcus iniae]
MGTVILAEKPSQALAYASAFQSSEKHDGYFEVKDSLFTEETIITFGFGHLVELAIPGEYKEEWAKWNLDNLPIFPENYQFVVAKDKKKQFKIVSGLLNKASTIIIATDSDREGENIAWSIIHKAGAYSENKIYKRLWINSLEKEAIRDGFKNLKDGQDYYPYYKEAQTRQIADWLIGMNGSPLYSLYLQKEGVEESFSLGRVQTPTLYMIYKKQREFEQFVKRPYFELAATLKTVNQEVFKGTLKPGQSFNTKEELQNFIVNCGTPKQGKTMVSDITTKEKKTSSPLLFSLSLLQTQANKLFKASADETLKAVQTLYEAKLLTYPRTDSNYITGNEFAYLKANLERYKLFMDNQLPTNNMEPRKRYVDDEKVQEHHAIILTKQVPTADGFEKLTELQKNIYLLIAKTTIAMFMDDYKYSETVIKIMIKNLSFETKGKTPLEQGWKKLFILSKEKEVLLPNLNKNDILDYHLEEVEKETRPPKLYTEGTLITAMKTAGKTVDNEKEQELLKEIEGIGTEATRASIIETLKQKKYIFIFKNNLLVSEKGKLLCMAVENEPLLTSAEMTAKWENYLKKIGQSSPGVNQDKFLNSIQKFVNHLIDVVPGQIEQIDFSAYKVAKQKEEEKKTIGTCPSCQKGLLKQKKGFYGCTQYPDCDFTIFDNFRRKKLTKTNLIELIEGKETIVKGVKIKDKTKTYNAVIKLVDGKFEQQGFYKK